MSVLCPSGEETVGRLALARAKSFESGVRYLAKVEQEPTTERSDNAKQVREVKCGGA